MNNLCTLVKYEWKKLLQKKRVVIAIGIVLGMQIFSNLSFLTEYYTVDTTDANGNVFENSGEIGYERMVRDRKNAKALDGRRIDDDLLSEFREYGAAFDGTGDERQYQEIYYLLSNVFEEPIKIKDSDAKELYHTWKDNILQYLKLSPLSAGEIDYWEGRLEEVKEPFTYQYSFSWKNILEQSMQNGIMVLMLVVICLSGIFADEHQLKTDQMILCMKNGKKAAYFAKVIAGVSLGTIFALLLYGVSFLSCFYFYGTRGFDAILQLKIVDTPFAISVGQAVVIMFSLTVIAGIMESAFAMMLSEYLNNSIAVMAVMVGMMLSAQFIVIPQEWRILSQIWDFIPTKLIVIWRFTDGRLVHIPGKYLTNFQFSVLLYSVLTILFVWLGKRKYQQFQVTGR